MKTLETGTATLVALAFILGLPGPASADHTQGHDIANQRHGKTAPVIQQGSIPKASPGGSVIIPDKGSEKEGTLPLLTADASCHDPCDDAFKLKAWVKDGSGRGVKGIQVTFSFQLASGLETAEAQTDSSGYAHLHLKLNPSAAPQGVRVEVTARCTQGEVARTATSWFTPNYN